MSKDKDKRLEEKWDAEVARSLSVVELKKAHKEIEDGEKLRRKDAIKSIRERLLLLRKYCDGVHEGIDEACEKDSRLDSLSLWTRGKIPKLVTSIISIYESIRLDFQRTIEVNKEDFDRLFPKLEIDMNNYGQLSTRHVLPTYASG